MPTYSDRVLQRFWGKVDKSAGPEACWPWTASAMSSGHNSYGGFRFNNKMVRSHRFAYESTTGEQLGKLQCDHNCIAFGMEHNNKLCCNPLHLRPATNKQNKENMAGARGDSQTGIRGVTPAGKKAGKANAGKYLASLGHNGKKFHLGYFDTVEEAAVAAQAGRLKMFTHNDVDKVVS